MKCCEQNSYLVNFIKLVVQGILHKKYVIHKNGHIGHISFNNRWLQNIVYKLGFILVPATMVVLCLGQSR